MRNETPFLVTRGRFNLAERRWVELDVHLVDREAVDGPLPRNALHVPASISATRLRISAADAASTSSSASPSSDSMSRPARSARSLSDNSDASFQSSMNVRLIRRSYTCLGIAVFAARFGRQRNKPTVSEV